MQIKRAWFSGNGSVHRSWHLRTVGGTAVVQRFPGSRIADRKRYVRRSLDQDLFEEVQARVEEPEFRQKLSERIVEHGGPARRGEAKPWTDPRKVSQAVESADSGVSERDGAEPETPGVPILLLVDCLVDT